LRAVAAGIEERGIHAVRGGKWSPVQVARLLGATGIPFDGSALTSLSATRTTDPRPPCRLKDPMDAKFGGALFQTGIGMGSPGIGTIPHLAGETMTGVEMVHVPYRGDPPVIADLLAGRVQVSFPAPVATIEHIRAGKLRALAVTTATRWEGLPNIPTLSEFVPGYEAFSLFGVGAPRNTPAEIIGRLNTEINAGLADPKIKARLADLGGTVLAGSPADFGRLVTTETEKWRKVIRTANIEPQ